MAEVHILGHEFKLEYDTGGGWGSETFSEVRARAVTPKEKRPSVEVTRRGDTNMKYAFGLLDVDLEVQLPYRKDGTTEETVLAAFNSALEGKTNLILAVGNGLVATTGTKYLKCEYGIEEKSQPQEINGEAFITYTLKPADSDNDATYTTTP